MDAVGLALISAALFGAMPVAVRLAYARPLPAAFATVVMQLVMLLILVVGAAVQGGMTPHGIWPFLVAGAIAPGVSQIFITLGIQRAGSSRSSVAFGTAPVFAITIAVVVLGERPALGVLAGAGLVVLGGVALALERDRPEHLRRIGIAFALVGAVLFAIRDNLFRHLSVETDVPALTGGAGTLVGALAVAGTVALVRRDPARLTPAAAGRWAVPGACLGLSYVALFLAFNRGEVSVVASIVATESLFGVVFSLLLLRQSERIGLRIVLGAALVVAGGILIALTR
jgi:drug/metabolite transporter (DMT)-like permease